MVKPKKLWTQNEAVEMTVKYFSDSLITIVEFVKKHEYEADEIIDYLIELSEEMAAQALTVALRDELNFTKPTD